MQIKVTLNDGTEHKVDYDSATDTVQILSGGENGGTSAAWADVAAIEVIGDEAPAPAVDLFDASGGDRPAEPVQIGTDPNQAAEPQAPVEPSAPVEPPAV